MSRASLPVLTALLALGACNSSSLRRFPDRLPLLREPEQPFSARPSVTKKHYRRHNVDDRFFSTADRLLALAPAEAAWNVNSLDEVPASSWFEPRLGARAVTADEVAHGGETGEPAIDVAHDLRVVSAKSEGATGGFMVEDANGVRFVLKFDPVGLYGVTTGADAVGSRLMWALGYNVPDNRIVLIDPARFRADDDDLAAGVARVLAVAARSPDGQVRALVSRFLPGDLLGPFLWQGTRRDDPNDRVPHEHRRELRALRIFYAWINNPDNKTGNSLDTWMVGPDGGVVKHWLMDFGTSLGVGGGDTEQGWWVGTGSRPLPAMSDGIDDAGTSLDTTTVRRIRRARERDPLLAGLHATVNPWAYDWSILNGAFARLDDADTAWAARVLLSFTDERLRAAAAASDWDPADQERLVRLLASRRDHIARLAFLRATPLGRPVVRGARVCVDDLALRHRLVASRAGGYRVSGATATRHGATVCLTLPRRDGYHIIRVAVRDRPTGELRVHVLRGDDTLRIIGVEHD